MVTNLEEFTCAMYVSLQYFEAEVSNIHLSQFVPVWCQGPIIPVDIAEEDDTLESDDDVASLSEEEVMSDDSAVAEGDSDEY